MDATDSCEEHDIYRLYGMSPPKRVKTTTVEDLRSPEVVSILSSQEIVDSPGPTSAAEASTGGAPPEVPKVTTYLHVARSSSTSARSRYKGSYIFIHMYISISRPSPLHTIRGARALLSEER